MLSELVSEGLIIAEGKTKTRRYSIAHPKVTE